MIGKRKSCALVPFHLIKFLVVEQVGDEPLDASEFSTAIEEARSEFGVVLSDFVR